MVQGRSVIIMATTRQGLAALKIEDHPDRWVLGMTGMGCPGDHCPRLRSPTTSAMIDDITNNRDGGVGYRPFTTKMLL